MNLRHPWQKNHADGLYSTFAYLCVCVHMHKNIPSFIYFIIQYSVAYMHMHVKILTSNADFCFFFYYTQHMFYCVYSYIENNGLHLNQF